ncbi:MAG: ubiquinone/menaquinone biosynthesis methyltransferase [Thermoguttaceae bacterium]
MPTKQTNRVEKTAERIGCMFDEIAPRYDTLNSILSINRDRYWRRKTADIILAQPLPDGPILDICCGTGELTLALSHQLSMLQQNRELFGIDFSPKMIEIAQQKRSKMEQRISIKKKIADSSASFEMVSPHFSVGDAMSLNFPSEMFSASVVAFGIRNVVDPNVAMSEMVRVTRPGGIVAILEFAMPTFPVFSLLYRCYFRSILPKIGQMLSRSQDQAYHYLSESVYQFDSPSQLAERMRHAGITKVSSRLMTCGIVALTIGHK